MQDVKCENTWEINDSVENAHYEWRSCGVNVEFLEGIVKKETKRGIQRS